MTKTIKTILATTIATVTLSANAEFLLMQPISADIAEVMIVEESSSFTPYTIPATVTYGSPAPSITFTVVDEDLFSNVVLPLEINLSGDNSIGEVMTEQGDFETSGIYNYDLNNTSYTVDESTTYGYTIEFDLSGSYTTHEYEISND
jgi:hypothetical protein